MLLALRAAANELPGGGHQGRHTIERDAGAQRHFGVKAFALNQYLLGVGLNAGPEAVIKGFREYISEKKLR